MKKQTCSYCEHLNKETAQAASRPCINFDSCLLVCLLEIWPKHIFGENFKDKTATCEYTMYKLIVVESVYTTEFGAGITLSP